MLDFWEAWRGRFSAEVQAIGDSASRKMTLQDLLAIETAEMALLDDQLLKTGSIRSRAILINAKVQARRNLRSLVLASGPAFNVSDLPVVLPIGMSEGDIEDRLEDQAIAARIAKHRIANPAASFDELRRAGTGEILEADEILASGDADQHGRADDGHAGGVGGGGAGHKRRMMP